MLKKSIYVLFLILFPALLFGYSSKNVKLISENGKFKLIITDLITPLKFKKNFYDYGVNISLDNFNFDKIFIKKINEKFLIKIIPIGGNRTLIKIQSLDKINNNLFDIKFQNNQFTVFYGYKKKLIQVKKKAQKTKIQPIEEFKIEKTDFISRVIKTYSLLAIICIFIIGLAFLLKKLKRSPLLKTNKEFFKIVYRQFISPKKEIAIIKVYNEYYLIGITDYNINLIAKLDSENLKEEIKLIEGENEKKKFIKYIKEENEKLTNKEKNLDKELLISSIEKKIKKYRDMIS